MYSIITSLLHNFGNFGTNKQSFLLGIRCRQKLCLLYDPIIGNFEVHEHYDLFAWVSKLARKCFKVNSGQPIDE